MRLRLLSMLIMGLCLCAYTARAEEMKILELENLPEGADPDDVKYLERKQKDRQEVLEKRKAMEAQLADKIKALADERKKLDEKKEVSVTVDGQELKGPEPRSMEDVLNSISEKPDHQVVRDRFDISPEDMPIEVHKRWSLNLSDFRIDPPQYIAENRGEKDKKWWGFTFSVTNTTLEKRRISPTFLAVTNKGAFNYSVGGFVPERRMADSLLRPLSDSQDLGDKELLSEHVSPLENQVNLIENAFDPAKAAFRPAPMENFEPGQTRWGTALWSNFSDEFTELKIVVRGLTNAYRYDDKLNYDEKDTEEHRNRIKETRALVYTFTRNADEFHNHSSLLNFAGKRWEYLWAWDQCINVPYPADAKDPQLKIMPLKTPAGADKLTWAFPFTVSNATRTNQDFTINTISYVCDVKVNVGGTALPEPLEVRVVDDGLSSIYKAQVLKTLGKAGTIKDRFQYTPVEEGSRTIQQRRKITLEPSKALEETWAIFDEADVDWDNVKFQVESMLTSAADKKALSAQTWAQTAKEVAQKLKMDEKELLQKNPGFLYDPRRRLTDEEFTQVKEQVLKALPAALDAAKDKKTVVAYFDCASGMASGVCRVKRSYAKPAAVEANWLSSWDEWMKGWEAAKAEGK